MKSGNSRVTSKDVAALAGVSQSAVSRAFTPGSSVSEAKKKIIFEAARKLKYVPNSLAAGLATRRTNMVAVILGDMENPFYTKVLKQLIAALQAQGTQVLTFGIDPDSTADDALLRVLRYQVDGIILTSAQISTRAMTMCEDRGIPVVLFNRYIPGAEVSVVRCDNRAGGRMIAQELLSAGAKTFVMLTGDPRGTTSNDRMQGFLDGLAEAGIRSDAVRAIAGGSRYEGGYSAVVQAFGTEGQSLPDAIFGINDAMATGAMDALRAELGLTLPRDIMVAGFDDIDSAETWPYRLTTVRQPIPEMVTETLALLSQTGEVRDIVLPVELVRRASIRAKG